MLRLCSWIIAIVSWLIPIGIFCWQLWMFQTKQGSLLNQQDRFIWLLSVGLGSLSIGAILSLIAMLLGVASLLRLPKNYDVSEGLRILELVVLALPLLIYLFFTGMVSL